MSFDPKKKYNIRCYGNTNNMTISHEYRPSGECPSMADYCQKKGDRTIVIDEYTNEVVIDKTYVFERKYTQQDVYTNDDFRLRDYFIYEIIIDGKRTIINHAYNYTTDQRTFIGEHISSVLKVIMGAYYHTADDHRFTVKWVDSKTLEDGFGEAEFMIPRLFGNITKISGDTHP